jgi:membrane-associated phospholipid phosphatase
MKLKPLFFFLIYFSSISFPQFKEISTDFNKFFITGKETFIAPAKWKTSDWLILSGTAAVIAGSSLADEHVRDIALNNKSSFNDFLFQYDKYFNFAVPFIGIVGTYGYGLAFKDPKIRNLGLQLTEACAYSGIITVALKSIAGRSRPYSDKGNMNWNPFTLNNDQLSFPSGHATLSFAFCTVMANYLDNIYWKIGWYSIAAIVSSARIYHDQHWLSDVIAGSAVGYFIGSYVSHNPENRSEQEGRPISDFNFSFSIPLHGLSF